MPGNTGASPFTRSRVVKLSRNSSLTWRVRKRSSEKILRRNSPSVRGRLLMKGTPTNKLSPIIRAGAIAVSRPARDPESRRALTTEDTEDTRRSLCAPRVFCGYSCFEPESGCSARVPVPASLLPRPCRATKIGKNTHQVLSHRMDAMALGARGEQLLFEVEIKWQRAREIKSHRALIGGRQVLHCSGK